MKSSASFLKLPTYLGSKIYSGSGGDNSAELYTDQVLLYMNCPDRSGSTDSNASVPPTVIWKDRVVLENGKNGKYGWEVPGQFMAPDPESGSILSSNVMVITPPSQEASSMDIRAVPLEDISQGPSSD